MMLRTLFAFDCDAANSITSSSNPALEPNHTSKRNRKKQQYLPVHRRRFKSALYFACWPTILAALLFLSSCSVVCSFATNNNKSALNKRRHEWIGKSVQYYSTVMRKQAASAEPTLSLECDNDIMLDENFIELATKHYYARFLIKQGKWSSAEKIYRRIIDELASEEECDNTKLAVSTLLLALHMQRTGDIKATRAVFLNFFRRVALAEDEEEVHSCSCSAKVLQAFALFEMKNGFSGKSLMLVQRAVQMDQSLSPVLGWKQFRDAAAGRPYRPTFSFRSRKGGDE
eukprot:scaffold25275_cov60-Cyclotella_meneghiniana.AAC.2